MKKLFIVLLFVFVLFGCSNNENSTKSTNKGTSDNHIAVAKSAKNASSLEDKINKIIDQQGWTTSKDIFDYEIKNNYIFVLTYSKVRGILLTTLKYDANGLKFVRKDFPDETTLFAESKKGPFIIVIQPEDKDVKDVTAFGQPTKLIKMTKILSNGYQQEIKCWIYISDDIGKPFKDYRPDKDIKYIK